MGLASSEAGILVYACGVIGIEFEIIVGGKVDYSADAHLDSGS